MDVKVYIEQATRGTIPFFVVMTPFLAYHTLSWNNPNSSKILFMEF